MSRYIIRPFICILLIFILIVGFKRLNIVKENLVLKEKVIDTVEKSKSIDFAKTTDFDWDTMYILTPYAPVRTYFKKERIKFYNTSFDIEYIDDINMIAFVKSNKVVAYINLPRKYGKFDVNYEVEGLTGSKFSRMESKFDVSEKNIIIFSKE